MVDMFGLKNYEGLFKLTTDRKTLELLDYTNIPKPGIKKIPSETEVWDDLRVKKLDRYRLDQILFAEIHTGENEEEVIILPVQFSMDFYIGLRPGIGSINGPS
jgi:hypothetical protein